MVDEKKKDFNKMLHETKGMPKIKQIIDEKSIEKYGGKRMLLAPPVDYNQIMGRIPLGQVVTISKIREYLAERYGADFTDPITAGIFVSIAAWASEQRKTDKIPFWRTLKANGELNPKYPGGIEKQKSALENEGHTILIKGRKNLRYYVKDFTEVLAQLSK